MNKTLPNIHIQAVKKDSSVQFSKIEFTEKKYHCDQDTHNNFIYLLYFPENFLSIFIHFHIRFFFSPFFMDGDMFFSLLFLSTF